MVPLPIDPFLDEIVDRVRRSRAVGRHRRSRAPARRRASRRRCSTTARSSCCSRAGWPPARWPRGSPRSAAGRSAARSAGRSASTAGSAPRHAAARRHRRRPDRAAADAIRCCPISRPSSSTSFTSAASTPTSAIALARQAWRARDDLRIVVMSATIDVAARSRRFSTAVRSSTCPGACIRSTSRYAPGQSVADAAADVIGSTARPRPLLSAGRGRDSPRDRRPRRPRLRRRASTSSRCTDRSTRTRRTRALRPSTSGAGGSSSRPTSPRPR